jgi:phosphatidylserine/phosphatidylglycerophosphate/cardiolipin synthase-like enzyme
VSRLIERFDGLLGGGVEATVRDHHRRRMRRAGQLGQLDPPHDGSLWAAGDPPPRAGCELELLIDGAQALPAIADAIAGARSHVHIAGWHITPDFGLVRDAHAARLRDVLAELAERVEVRVLLFPSSRPAAPPCGACARSWCGERGCAASWTRTSGRCTATTRSS